MYDLPESDLVWVPGVEHQVPSGAVSSGTALDLSPVYVARFGTNTAYYDPRETYAVYDYMGIQHTTTWEVLTI